MDDRVFEGTSSRRQFLLRGLSVASFAGIAIVVGACGSEDGGGSSGTGGCQNPVSAVVGVGGGHTHSVRDICQSDSGGSVNLTLTGAGHTHEATLTAVQVDQVLAGTMVQVTSSDDGHTHTVTFN